MKYLFSIILFVIICNPSNAEVSIMHKTVPPLYNYLDFCVQEKMVESEYSSVGIDNAAFNTPASDNIKKMHKKIKSIPGVTSVHVKPYFIQVRKARIYTWVDIEKKVDKIIRSALSDKCETHTTISYQQRCPWCKITQYIDYYVKKELEYYANSFGGSDYKYSFSRCASCKKDYICKVTTDHTTYYTMEKIK